MTFDVALQVGAALREQLEHGGAVRRRGKHRRRQVAHRFLRVHVGAVRRGDALTASTLPDAAASISGVVPFDGRAR